MEQEPTTKEILEAINNFSTRVDEQFDHVKSEIGGLKLEIGWIKSNMVTKDFLDDKIAELKGDLIALIRKEDTKLKTLVEILSKRKVIVPDEVKKILSMEPFAQLYF